MTAGSAYSAAGVLPLRRDAGSRYGPWIVAASLFVVTLALAATMAIRNAEQGWRTTLAGKISVQVPAPSGTGEDAVAEIVALLRATPAIADAEPVDPVVARSLLEPWLGAGAEMEALPVPALIDVRLQPDAGLDIVALEVALDAAVPGTRIDDHGIRLAYVLRFALALQVFGAAVAAIFGLIATMTAIFATRAGLSSHREEIGILQAIGAGDGYIARQFVAHSANVSIKGGIVGCALAAGALILLARYAPGGNAFMVPEMTLSPIQWIVLACLPPVAAVIAMAAARVTAMRALSRVI